MVKVKVKGGNLTKFLDAWDKKTYDLKLEIKKIYLKQKREQTILRKKEGFAFKAHK